MGILLWKLNFQKVDKIVMKMNLNSWRYTYAISRLRVKQQEWVLKTAKSYVYLYYYTINFKFVMTVVIRSHVF